MKLIRTFHPIGQGAFYTEKHSIGRKKITIVYDCGSKTLSESELKTKVQSTFSKDEVIHTLFISHFHEDHINGIVQLKNHCKIKSVVLPYLSPESKLLIKISNFVNGYYPAQLIDDPQSFFGEEVSVITVDIDNPKNQDQEYFIRNDNHTRSLSDILTRTIKKIASGTPLKLSPDTEWFFIPFNYKQNTGYNKFIDALKEYELELEDINTIEKMYTYKEEITQAYRETNSDLNETSMILFSGKKNDDKIYTHHSPCCFLKHHSGCLYMGDINLKRRGIVRDITNSLKEFITSIGTIQIPHHGSIHNFKSDILTDNIFCAIFSYGTNNTYGHPSDKVIGDICINGVFPLHVTEQKNSIIVQTTM